MTMTGVDGDHERRAGPAPLDGIRVVELANYLAGPFATMMLADLGATVIKVEQPKGDPFRRFGRPDTYVSAYFANCNHGKRSVLLDLKTPEGVAGLLSLAGESDILVCNWRPDVAERLGVGDAALVRANDRLIRIYISGFGPTGPLADSPAFDTVLQARSGMTEAVSTSDEPTLVPGYPVDKLTAVMAAQAALAALVARGRDGRGDRIDLAMLDAAAYLNFVDLLPARAFVDHAPPEARNRQSSAVRPLRAADGWILLAPVSADQIRRACRVAEHPEWAEEVLSVRDAVAMVHALFDRLEPVIRTATVRAWLQRFGDSDLPVGPCLGIDEHLADAQVAHNRVYTVAEWPEVGRVRTPRYPARFSSADPLPAPSPAPLLGADTDEILSGLDATTAAQSSSVRTETTARSE
jgi:crotonobetainyl-CoA:carnitine CoA-transferase CaiB-like acyl-CoA transferase